MCEFHVVKYKNLRRVRIPISERLVLYGVNGAGKTNLLEALALMAGDDLTVSQVARRCVTPGAGSIEAVITNPVQLPAGQRRDAPFWAMLGLDTVPDSWGAGIEASMLPEEFKAALRDVSRCAIRYSVESVEGLDAMAGVDRGRAYREGEEARSGLKRLFERTLCVHKNIAGALRGVSRTLPDAAMPVLADGVDRGDWVDVLTLPQSGSIPLEVVWLSRERTDDELWHDYVVGVGRAGGAIRALIEAARTYLSLFEWADSQPGAEEWPARCWFARRSQHAINELLPAVVLSPDDDWLTLSLLGDRSETLRIGEPGDLSWISRLSSGERALLDEALIEADLAMRVDEWDAKAAVVALTVETANASDEELLELHSVLEGPLSGPVRDGYWMVEDVDALIAWGKRCFEARTGRSLRPAIDVVRIYDEPERHLHPGARSKLANALHDRVTGDTTILATHDAAFLARDGWQHLHLRRSPEGVVVAPFEPAELTLLHAVARDLGLRGGDLLIRYRYVLLVEGVHDEAFLDGFCGDLLGAVGVLVLPMHGVDEVLQAAQAHLVVRHLDSGIGVLVDHSRTKSGTALDTKEGRLLAELERDAKRRGVTIDIHRLTRPDVIAYLDDDEIRRHAPAFPGFRVVEEHWRKSRGRDFKAIAADLADGLTFDRRIIRDLAARTATKDDRRAGDLDEALAAITAAALRPHP